VSHLPYSEIASFGNALSRAEADAALLEYFERRAAPPSEAWCAAQVNRLTAELDEFLARRASEAQPPTPEPPEPRPRRRRRLPSVATLLKQAEKTGRPVTSITTPDGVTLTFGQAEPSEANNPWLADMKATKQ
jgi:hypothetical protein